MNIGEVHSLLREEFPSLLLSKLRYFEAEGLVVLPDGRPMVAVDRKKAKDNLHLLEPAIAGASAAQDP